MMNVSLANSTNTLVALVGIKKCVVCQNGITKSVSGDTCSFDVDCGPGSSCVKGAYSLNGVCK